MPKARSFRHVSDEIATHQGNIPDGWFRPNVRGAHWCHVILRSNFLGERGRTRGERRRENTFSAGNLAQNPSGTPPPPRSSRDFPQREKKGQAPCVEP